jgi:hypothetical protein
MPDLLIQKEKKIKAQTVACLEIFSRSICYAS